jgi:fatty acid desaturase
MWALLWLVLWTVAFVLGEKGLLGASQCIFLTTISAFGLFTVMHDAAHGAVSSNWYINELFGRLATLIVAPPAGAFSAWRFMHNQHHKHTNDSEKDPDHYSIHGPPYLLPFHWGTQLVHYSWYYAKHVHQRPLWEAVEFVVTIALNILGIAAAIYFGMGRILWIYWLIPSFCAQLVLVFLFDFLPHYGHHSTPADDRYDTTSMLYLPSYLEPLGALVMQWQNYHVIHHLYPRMPFYRYADMWEQKKDFLLNEKKISVKNLL